MNRLVQGFTDYWKRLPNRQQTNLGGLLAILLLLVAVAMTVCAQRAYAAPQCATIQAQEQQLKLAAPAAAFLRYDGPNEHRVLDVLRGVLLAHGIGDAVPQADVAIFVKNKDAAGVIFALNGCVVGTMPVEVPLLDGIVKLIPPLAHVSPGLEDDPPTGYV